MANKLQGRDIAILATDGVEKVEIEAHNHDLDSAVSFVRIRTDLRNACAHVVDAEMFVDGNLISSRSPAFV